MSVETIKELIEAIESAINAGDWKVDGACDPTLVLIRAKKLIEQAQKPEGHQEPVAWKDRTYGNLHHQDFGNSIPLYTSPPQRQPLSDEEIWDLHIKMSTALDCKLSNLIEMTRAIEAAHGIKGEA